MSETLNLLIDLGAIKTGGGAQLALNFLDLLARELKGQKRVVLIPQQGPLAKFVFDSEKFIVYTYPDPYLARFWFESTRLPAIVERHSITHFFTFFGAGLPHSARIRSVVTTAYPILCYPESPFWPFAPVKTRWKNYFTNWLRRRRLRRADTIIVETAVMKARIARSLPFAEDKLVVLPPVPSLYLREAASRRDLGAPCNFILVSGSDPHKNLWRLPELALALERAGLTRFRFTLTVKEHNFLQHPRIDRSLWPRVSHYFRFLGAVAPQLIESVYEEASFLVNLSDLESFSNNYMEAWKAGLPIIASDRDFARHICGDSACYIEPHHPEAGAQAIAALVADHGRQARMLAAGRQKLAALGNERERFARVMAILETGGAPGTLAQPGACAGR